MRVPVGAERGEGCRRHAGRRSQPAKVLRLRWDMDEGRAREDRLLFAGIIVIAANAGGAWSPIGDVTTTMLWIGGQVTSLAVMQGVFLASIVNLLVPLTAATWMAGGRAVLAPPPTQSAGVSTTVAEQTVVLVLGLGVLVLVPVFKAVTHLPPFMGILLGLGVLWLVGDLMHRQKDEADSKRARERTNI